MSTFNVFEVTGTDEDGNATQLTLVGEAEGFNRKAAVEAAGPLVQFGDESEGRPQADLVAIRPAELSVFPLRPKTGYEVVDSGAGETVPAA